jgi:hypothetical protein
VVAQENPLEALLLLHLEQEPETSLPCIRLRAQRPLGNTGAKRDLPGFAEAFDPGRIPVALRPHPVVEVGGEKPKRRQIGGEPQEMEEDRGIQSARQADQYTVPGLKNPIVLDEVGESKGKGIHPGA